MIKKRKKKKKKRERERERGGREWGFNGSEWLFNTKKKNGIVGFKV
jgi:hypothetical protein